MKKVLITIITMLLPVMASAQSKLSAVTLKNGTTLQGVIKSIDPTDAVTIEIAGVETMIKMDTIQKIEEVGATSATFPTLNDQGPLTDKLRVTDFANYPETFDLKVGSQIIKMILVRGGEMNMGYDGRHSLKYNSEPVHKVKVTSYYMSDEYIPTSLVSEIDPSLPDKKDLYYSAKRYEKMNEIVKTISQKTDLPIRIPTEAEWEYAACSETSSILFKECKDYEFCSDWFANFEAYHGAIDPEGPIKGDYHVVRSFGKFESKFYRGKFSTQVSVIKKYSRVVVKAKDVIDHLK